MGIIPLSIIAICQFWTTVDLILNKDYAWAVVFFCFGVSSLSFIWMIYFPEN